MRDDNDVFVVVVVCWSTFLTGKGECGSGGGLGASPLPLFSAGMQKNIFVSNFRFGGQWASTTSLIFGL